jgi:hypothetical protein
MGESYRKHGKVKVVYRISVGKTKPPGSPGYRQGDNTVAWCLKAGLTESRHGP